MNSKILNKCINILLVTLNLLFLIYYFLLAFYSHPHYDDLHFMWRMNEMSIFEYVKEMYFSRSGRFAGYGLNGIIFSVINFIGCYQFWPIIFYALGIFICWLAFKDYSKQIESKYLLNFIFFFYNLYILINIDFAVFFWYCAMAYYLFGPICCLMINYLNKKILKWYENLLLLLLSIYIGGSLESFTPIVLLLMFINGLYYLNINKWNIKETWKLAQVRRIVYVAVILLVSLLIVVIAPGNYLRLSDTTQFVQPVGLIGWFNALFTANITYFYFMSFYLPYMFVLFAISYMIGSYYKSKVRLGSIKVVVILFAFILIYTFISSIPNVFLYGGFGIQRTYTHCVFMLLLFVSLSGYILGCNNSLKILPYNILSTIGVISLIIIMSINIYKDIPIAKEYSDAVNSRIDYLKELQETENTMTVIIKELPSPNVHDVKYNILSLLGKKTDKPSLYYISDADTIPNEYEYHLKRVYNLDFDFVIDK